MTRLSISIAATMLTITLAPVAQAYGTDPDQDMLRQISQTSLLAGAETTPSGTCTVKVSPAIAEMLGLPADWRAGDGGTSTEVACNGDD